MLMVQLDDCSKRRYVTKFHCPRQLWGRRPRVTFLFADESAMVHWYLFRYSMGSMFGHFHGWLLFRIVKSTSRSSQLYILHEWTGVKQLEVIESLLPSCSVFDQAWGLITQMPTWFRRTLRIYFRTLKSKMIWFDLIDLITNYCWFDSYERQLILEARNVVDQRGWFAW